MAGRSDQVRRIIDAVGSPALRANIDTGNFLLVNQNPTDVRGSGRPGRTGPPQGFRRARADETEHVYKGLDGTGFTGAVVGQGESGPARDRRDPGAAGYDGWLSLEYEGGDDPLTVGVPESLRAAQHLI
ncbi:MAG: hypothetical protein R2851_16985 [Caldilineaceae bacterium]